MGTIKKGILGGFSGKVGTVVGGTWKGISYMRSLPAKVKNPRTEKQLSHRSKFTLALNLLKPMTDLLRTGWKLQAHRQSPFNAAMAHTISNAIAGTYPDYTIKPEKVFVSRGALTPAVNATASAAGLNLTISWDNNSDTGSAKTTDKALIAVLNSDKKEAVTITAGAERSKAIADALTLPATWTGDNIQTYLGFISQDGKEVADSVFISNIKLT